MYYKNEFCEDWFDDYNECCEDLICNLDLEEYTSYIDVKDILIKFFRRKNNETFCSWLTNKVDEIDEIICNELITEIDDEEYEQLCEINEKPLTN